MYYLFIKPNAFEISTSGYLEQSLYHTNVAPLNRMFKTNNYFRYLDDILLIFDKSLIDMNSISFILNNLHPDLVLKLETVVQQ